MGTKFAFEVEKELVRAKIRTALSACVYNGFTRVLIGNFGLGNSARNPARELAELWRDVFLYDPDFRGRFVQVCGIFHRMRGRRSCGLEGRVDSGNAISIYLR